MFRKNDAPKTPTGVVPLTAEDLVPDRPLGSGQAPIAEGEDLLHHRAIARRIAELTVSTAGNTNIALLGPWGSGKSSFNALLREELKRVDNKVIHLTFDAWKNSGEGFQANFLSEISSQLGGSSERVRSELFDTKSTVEVPVIGTLTTKRGLAIGLSVLTALFLAIPLLWTVLLQFFQPGGFAEFWEEAGQNVAGWAGAAAGSTLLLAVLATLSKLSQVTVQRSTPSSVAQFSVLFDQALEPAKKRRYVIFVDELDRCSPDDVMRTLEGLRTFLGHKDCVFVVAFDREAVAATVATRPAHAAPMQTASPYYVTSGEYLDKIFQFQISLPPQPMHTFRRYALSLVENRGGVWAEVRNSGPERLDKIVAVLSPMHLTSPRRTKVLLNDFAVNARVYEGLGFDWVARAEEIAVLTVLQTEFPRLSADIEREPGLLHYLQSEEEPQRPGLVDVVSEYRALLKDPSQEGATDAKQEDADAEPLDVVRAGTPTRLVVGLEQNLARYLNRLADLAIAMPKADLVMMHSDGDLLSFDDPQVYNILQVAADSTRGDVLAGLEAASVRDKQSALTYVLEQVEAERGVAAKNLAILAGEIANSLDELSSDMASKMFVGFHIDPGFSPTSLAGYVRAAITAEKGSELDDLLSLGTDLEDASLETLLSAAVAHLGTVPWSGAGASVARYAAWYPRELPNVIEAFLRRAGDIEGAEFGEKSTVLLINELQVAAPTAPGADPTATAVAVEASNAAYRQKVAAHEHRVAQVEVAVAGIARAWPELPLQSPLRAELLHVLREVEQLDVHDELVQQTAAQGFVSDANLYLLRAIEHQPTGAARWVRRLDDSVVVAVEPKARALAALVDVATSAEGEARRDLASTHAEKLASLQADGSLDTEALEDEISEDIARPWQEYSDTRLEYQLRLIEVLGLLGAPTGDLAEKRRSVVEHAAVAAEQEEAEPSLLVSAVRSLAPEDAHALGEALHTELETLLSPTRVILTVLLEAQVRARRASLRVEPLTSDVFADFASPLPMLDLWVRTGPSVDEVNKTGSVRRISPDAWREYGAAVAPETRWAAWKFLREARAGAQSLRAVADEGLPDAAYTEMLDSTRDASSIAERTKFIDDVLLLPANKLVHAEVASLLKAMAAEGKVGEVRLGVRLLKAYSQYFSAAHRKVLRPLLTAWMGAGDAHIAKPDRDWLVRQDLIAKKSPLARAWNLGRKEF